MSDTYSKEWWENKYPNASAWRIYLPPKNASKGNRIKYVEKLPEGYIYNGEQADAIPLQRMDVQQHEADNQ